MSKGMFPNQPGLLSSVYDNSNTEPAWGGERQPNWGPQPAPEEAWGNSPSIWQQQNNFNLFSFAQSNARESHSAEWPESKAWDWINSGDAAGSMPVGEQWVSQPNAAMPQGEPWGMGMTYARQAQEEAYSHPTEAMYAPRGKAKAPKHKAWGEYAKVARKEHKSAPTRSYEEPVYRKKEKEVPKDRPEDESDPKLQLRSFLNAFKEFEGGPYEQAREYAIQAFEDLPPSVHWRVCLALAADAKRRSKIEEARHWFRCATEASPRQPLTWLEYAKLAEECGQWTHCREIILAGLEHCENTENLIVKGIKHEERMDNLAGARALLSRLRGVNVDHAWRSLMEGGLLEARAGEIENARRVFDYLVYCVPWNGPIYNSFSRIETKLECFSRALSIIEKGLQEIPRYGPLWFRAFHLYELEAALSGYSKETMDGVRKIVARGLNSVPKELIWKVHFELAQVEERAGNTDLCRMAFVRCVQNCPKNLLWKVWMGAARMELSAGRRDVARKLLYRAYVTAARKMRALVLLECSRVEEFGGDIEAARSILCRAKKHAQQEWKVFLEAVLLEIRCNRFREAKREAEEALQLHTGTGRLWAVLIQLHQMEGTAESQMEVFKKALSEVPKSGEVWCEGARIMMALGRVEEARSYLGYAIQFTPQYGDSFIESLRLLVMRGGSEEEIKQLERQCINADPNYGSLWLFCKRCTLDGPRSVMKKALEKLREDPKFCYCEQLTLLATTDQEEDRKKMIFGADPIKP